MTMTHFSRNPQCKYRAVHLARECRPYRILTKRANHTMNVARQYHTVHHDDQSHVATQRQRTDADGLPVRPGQYVIHPEDNPKSATPVTVFEDELTLDLCLRIITDRGGEHVQRVDELAEDVVFLRRSL